MFDRDLSDILSERSLLLNVLVCQQIFQFFDQLFHPVHLVVVMMPNFTSPHGLPLCHLSGPDNFIHKESKKPYTEKAHGNDYDQQLTQTRNTEEDH